MSKETKSAWEKFIRNVWVPISFFMVSVNLIQIGDNFWPNILRWIDFFEFWIDSMRKFRDWLFTPFNLIGIEVPIYLRDYLVFGFFVVNSFVSTMFRKNNNEDEKLFFLKWYDKGKMEFVKNLISFLIVMFLAALIWPVLFLLILIGSTWNRIKEKSKELYLFALMWMFKVLITVTLILLFNYFIIAINE